MRYRFSPRKVPHSAQGPAARSQPRRVSTTPLQRPSLRLRSAFRPRQAWSSAWSSSQQDTPALEGPRATNRWLARGCHLPHCRPRSPSALFGSVRTLAIRWEAPRFASGACLRVADALSRIPATPAAAQLKTRTIATDRLPHIGVFERLAPTLSDRSECRSTLAARSFRALFLSPRKTRHASACQRAHAHLAQ